MYISPVVSASGRRPRPGIMYVYSILGLARTVGGRESIARRAGDDGRWRGRRFWRCRRRLVAATRHKAVVTSRARRGLMEKFSWAARWTQSQPPGRACRTVPTITMRLVRRQRHEQTVCMYVQSCVEDHGFYFPGRAFFVALLTFLLL